MIAYLLLTTRDCHLCAHGRAVLDALAAEGMLDWQEIDADTPQGQILARTAPPLRPALFDTEGRLVAYGRLSEQRLRRQLQPSRTSTRTA